MGEKLLTRFLDDVADVRWPLSTDDDKQNLYIFQSNDGIQFQIFIALWI